MGLLDNYYLNSSLPMNGNNIEKYILSHNDKYLKVSKYKNSFWNIFDILEIDYHVFKDKLYIKKAPSSLKIYNHSQVCLINNNDPFKELIEKRDCYKLILKFNNKNYSVTIKSPIIYNKNEIKNHLVINNNNIFIKFQNLNNDLNFLNEIKSPVENFIIDLTGNTGGSVKKSIDFLEYFIQYKENIVYFKSRYNKYKITCLKKETIIAKNIIILIDRRTLSSAKLIAKALKVKCNAKIYGCTSGGKNIITNIFRYKSYYIKVPQFIYYFKDEVDNSPHIIVDRIIN